ncbi:hypothetical protein [Sphingopyxis sp.]|uniref:hypothetical protein n=1 Tax=Sphingopyxis sp. TaxID=1908224 RepID=UPI0035AE3C77
MRFCGPALLAAALLLGPQPAAAQGTLTSKVELEKLTSASPGQPAAKSYTSPDVVVPGDRVRIFTNGGAAPAADVKIVNPIPEGLVFDGTSDLKDFTVSVDGGKTFGAIEMLTVPVAGAAARPANLVDVTHVRWLWSTPIHVGTSRAVAFFGKVK